MCECIVFSASFPCKNVKIYLFDGRTMIYLWISHAYFGTVVHTFSTLWDQFNQSLNVRKCTEKTHDQKSNATDVPMICPSSQSVHFFT